jgi:hypothetical protein
MSLFMDRRKIMKHKTQRGSALVYILIAIALLAALTATFMDSSSQQTSSQSSFNTVAELNSQINFIRSAIEECVLTYPAGDTTMPATNPVGGFSPIRPYPLMPISSYLASPATGSSLVKDIRCPGNPGNSNNHAKIFSGTSGKFFPPRLNMFGEWHYINHSDGVFIFIATNRTDAFLDTALKKIDEQYAPCEVQYVDNSSGGAGVDFSPMANMTLCGAGTKCLAYRILTTASSVFPGEPAGTCP